MSPLELVDDRYGDLARELRATRPLASSALRARVRSQAPRSRSFDLNLRKLVPAIGLAALAVSLAVAGGLGALRGASGDRQALQSPVRKAARPLGATSTVPHGGSALPESALAPVAGRLQQYDANLTVRVGSRADLSKTTQDALRFTRRVGGFVVWARYAAPSDGGDSELALRVPVDRVQAAIAHFSAYGELVGQRVVLQDLQQRVDDLTARIAGLESGIAAIKRQLAGTLTLEQRASLQARLRRDQARLAALTHTKTTTVRRASLARIALTISERPEPAASPGRLHRTLHEAGAVLVRELEVLLYALVVAGPLLLLGLVALFAGRVLRRRSDQRLLERS
jgi:hypothetical protein